MMKIKKENKTKVIQNYILNFFLINTWQRKDVSSSIPRGPDDWDSKHVKNSGGVVGASAPYTWKNSIGGESKISAYLCPAEVVINAPKRKSNFKLSDRNLLFHPITTISQF